MPYVVARSRLAVRSDACTELDVPAAGVGLLCHGEQSRGHSSPMTNRQPEGAGPPPHRHDRGEAFHVLSGEVDVQVGAETIEAGPGAAVRAPGGTHHGVEGDPSGPAKVPVLGLPAHSEGFFVDVDREVKGPADEVHGRRIAETRGIHLLPG